MISARKNKLINSVFTIYHKRLLKKHFHQIYLADEENFRKINRDYPAIFYANHSNWWDGFIAYLLSSIRWKADDYIMMDLEQMKKYPFFKYLGAFSVNRDTPADAFKSIDYAVKLLKNTKRFLWIFPQGLMQPQDIRPIKFFSGAAKIAEMLNNANLIPVAIRYEFLLEQRPEVFIKIGEPDITDNILNTRSYTEYLGNKLLNVLDGLKNDVISQELGQYKVIFKGNESRNKTIDKLFHSK
jgi:1-acyl-sn-glycerol-3-phosphate acyltransferase